MLLPNRMVDVSVTREAAPTVVVGDIVRGAAETFTIRAHVQPVKGPELANYPEGMRTRRAIRLYTETALRAVDDEAGTPPDRLTYDGATFEVESVESRLYGSLGHYRAVAAQRAALPHACAGSCGVHGHAHDAARKSSVPVSNFAGFWGALGCSCFAF